MSAMGSCIKVVLKKIGFLLKKNGVFCNQIMPKRPLFCFGYSHNYKLTPAYVRTMQIYEKTRKAKRFFFNRDMFHRTRGG
jgi:hypothetical protein